MRLWAIVGVLIVGLFTASSDFRTHGHAAPAPLVAFTPVEPAAPPPIDIENMVEQTPVEDEDATPPALPAPDPFEGASAGALATGASPVLPKAEPPPVQWVSGPPPLPSTNVLGMAQTLLGVPYVGNNILDSVDH